MSDYQMVHVYCARCGREIQQTWTTAEPDTTGWWYCRCPATGGVR